MVDPNNEVEVNPAAWDEARIADLPPKLRIMLEVAKDLTVKLGRNPTALECVNECCRRETEENN